MANLEEDFVRTERPELIAAHPETGEQMLHPGALCVVHTTKYMPLMEGNTALIASRAHATDYEWILNSLHFTLNGRVSNGHLY